MNILLLTGGNSSERSVSLTSARNVKNVLLQNGHKVKLYDLKNGYKTIIALSKDFDVLFPVLHGEEGEGGKLHKYLSKLKKPVVGSRNYKGFQKAWYKIPFKKYCNKNNISTPRWKLIKKIDDVIGFGFPCVIKTSSGGSSREVFILKSKRELLLKSREIFSYQNLFVENYIQGQEATVGVLNNKALPVIEIIPPENSWFNYKNKYSGATQEIVDSKNISSELKNEMQKVTLKIHQHFNLGSYSRTDFMIDKNEQAYVLEINTIPGLTSESLLPKEIGMPFEKFIETLVKLSLDKSA